MRYGIALGSNLGDREWNLREAVRLLLTTVEPAPVLTASAPVYETAPVDCPEGSQNFLNTVVELEWDGQPLSLLRAMLAIEEQLGRPNAHAHHAPRTVDLDMLYADDVVMNEPELTLPHPRLAQRLFVLEPLAAIRPDLVLPGLGGTVKEALDRCTRNQ